MYAMNKYIMYYCTGNTPPIHKKNSNKENSLKDL
jgi:hypothetical protein